MGVFRGLSEFIFLRFPISWNFKFILLCSQFLKFKNKINKIRLPWPVVLKEPWQAKRQTPFVSSLRFQRKLKWPFLGTTDPVLSWSRNWVFRINPNWWKIYYRVFCRFIREHGTLVITCKRCHALKKEKKKKKFHSNRKVEGTYTIIISNLMRGQGVCWKGTWRRWSMPVHTVSHPYRGIEKKKGKVQ